MFKLGSGVTPLLHRRADLARRSATHLGLGLRSLTEVHASLFASDLDRSYRITLKDNGDKTSWFARGTETVEDLINDISQTEGNDIEVKTVENAIVGRSTLLDDLMRRPFQLSIGNREYGIIPPKEVADSRSFRPASAGPELHSVEDALQKIDRYSISQQEYNDLCKELGLSADEAESTKETLTNAGKIIALDHSEIDDIILKPHELLRYAAGHVDMGQREKNRLELIEKLGELRQKEVQWQDQTEQFKEAGLKHADRVMLAGLGWLSIQAGLISRLVWWDLDWGEMEPVTWIITFSTGILGYAFYAVTQREYEYYNLRHWLADRRVAKLKKAAGFSQQHQDEVASEISKLRDQIEARANHKLS